MRIEVDLSKYKNEYILNLLSQIEENKRALQKLSIDLELNKTNSEINLVNIEYAKNTLDKYQIDNLVSIDESIKNNLIQISELEKNLNIANINISDCRVVAQNDGVVNVIKDINVGDLLQSGVDVLTVVPNSGSEYKVQLYVNNKDIGTLKEGNKVKFHFYALPYKEYGELTGKISKVSVDSRIDGQTGTSYYLVECDVENRPLYSHKGEKAEIKLGMTCEAYVVTKRKKILHYLLEKINLKD
ncbi:HlyD family efflux transporter periplasmic adaptor subunit [Caloramator sp. mosi_1]|uniref:HlyD family efflux transporter periplasmic adaptor subunit n=1 Tax=Caloramator sp. mosi_1 TaxID=3023090 RepID=UPI00235F74EB|nr:HlyD family efflux transporter periplasmic adaptor subunit [Caloramator sp. mosi_1]WDC83397.1 HlyD family efflux transporter periplasmic adaptor subunit [Caloramator sp. mosi_1]